MSVLVCERHSGGQIEAREKFFFVAITTYSLLSGILHHVYSQVLAVTPLGTQTEYNDISKLTRPYHQGRDCPCNLDDTTNSTAVHTVYALATRYVSDSLAILVLKRRYQKVFPDQYITSCLIRIRGRNSSDMSC